MARVVAATAAIVMVAAVAVAMEAAAGAVTTVVVAAAMVMAEVVVVVAVVDAHDDDARQAKAGPVVQADPAVKVANAGRCLVTIPAFLAKSRSAAKQPPMAPFRKDRGMPIPIHRLTNKCSNKAVACSRCTRTATVFCVASRICTRENGPIPLCPAR